MRDSIRDVGVKALVLAAFFLTAPYSAAQELPLVDGDCDEYSRLKAKRIAISNDITLNIFQDKHFVWVCYGYPEASAMAQASASRYQVPAVRNDGWKTANADALGVYSTKLAQPDDSDSCLGTGLIEWADKSVGIG